MEKPDGFVDFERIPLSQEDKDRLEYLWAAYESARLTFNRANLIIAAKFCPTHDRYVHLENGFAVISVPGKTEFGRDAKNLGMLTGGGAGR